MGEEPVAIRRRGDDAAPLVDAFCRWCGSPEGTCDQVSCRRELDPPRHCPTCGRRLRVVVIPTGYRAACRDHGPLVE